MLSSVLGAKQGTRTEVVVLEAHAAVAHQVGIPVSDGGDEALERAGRADVWSKGWPERVHVFRLLTSSSGPHGKTKVCPCLYS